MGVTPAKLAKYYPHLYHMAEGSSWASIQRLGLLSTEALLEVSKETHENRGAILRHQRTQDVLITLEHGTAVLRDQKPLNRAKLEGCLDDGCTFDQWLQLLNSRVFFWLTPERLQTLMCAREYCAETHVVLTLDTLRLATDFQKSITLAPMNTGNTRPFAHRRSLSTFSRMSDYPFEDRLRRPLYYTVVELAVEGGVRNIMDYVTAAAEMRCSTCEKSGSQIVQVVKNLFP